MKRVLLLIIVLFFAVQAFCQSYHPMLGDSNTWYVKVSISSYPGPDKYIIYDYTSKYYTLGDSAVQGKTYKKFYVNDAYSTQSLSPVGFVGLIREDTTARKVYFLGKDSSTETLVYDFSLKQGDTMYINMVPPPAQYLNTYLPVPLRSGKYEAAVSTESTLEGSRKYIALSTALSYPFTRFYKDLDWLESIGSLKSPLYFYEPLNGEYNPGKTQSTEVNETVTLNCAYRNGVEVYSVGACVFDSTRINAGIANHAAPGLVLGHLICTQQYCSFHCDVFGNSGNLEILDMGGRIIQSFIINQQQDGVYQCNFTQPLSPGVYILNLQSGVRRFSQKVEVN